MQLASSVSSAFGFRDIKHSFLDNFPSSRQLVRGVQKIVENFSKPSV
jgi:hypothetical protein